MRILAVLREPLATEIMRQRCAELVADGHEIAVCYVLDAGATLCAGLDVQRKITALLRQTLANSAESVAVFVVTGTAGDEVADCARLWGATEVKP